MTNGQHSSIKLTGDQESFVSRVMATPAPAVHVLSAPAGTGKRTAAIEIIERLSRTRAKMRTLIVCPAALVQQFAARLTMRSPTLRVETMDRQRYRALEADVPINGSPFPQAAVVVVSRDVVKHTDVARGVLATQWDLLVVDEVNNLTGQRGQIVRQLLESHRADHVVLLSTTPADNLELSGTFVTTWASEAIHRTGVSGVRSIQRVPVVYTDPERTVLRATDARVDELERAGFPAMGKALRDRAGSAIYALERSLREIRNRAARGLNMDAPELAEVTPTQVPAPVMPSIVLEQAERILHLLDEVEVDSKTEALFRLLSTRLAVPAAYPVVVISRFAATVEYVATSLSNRGVPTRSLTAQMAPQDIAEAVANVYRPGVTVMTVASLRGLEFPAVGLWIFYEPWDEQTQYAVASRLLRPTSNQQVDLFEIAG
jgi:superfamily II DNA or RNA helicase